MKKFENIRTNYNLNQLRKGNLVYSPIKQFESWFSDSVDEDTLQPNSMILSTVSKDNVPSSRVVLLKHVDEKGFEFFTN